MRIEKKKIKDLKAAPYNPRKSSKEQESNLKASLEKFGVVEPIIYNEQTGHIVGGHFRARELKKLGVKEVDCVIVDLSEQDEKELNIRLNANTGDWDTEILLADWDKFELLEWGLDVAEWEDEQVTELEAVEDEFDVPEGGIKTDIVLGDMFEIGEHRLLCGDSIDSEQVAKLMNGEKADLGLTDPPYNIGYSYNEHDDNMSSKEYNNFIIGYVNNMLMYSEKQIITSGKQNVGYYYKNFDITEFAVWYAKNKMSGSKISNLGLCEPILFIGKFNRNARPTDMFEFNVKQQSDTGGHTCPKVMSFFSDLLLCYSDKLIFDSFLGSGTTMVAAHQLNRKCYGMELDPKYCQVIIDRMMKLDPDLKIKKNGVDYVS